jgi:Peptidase family S41
MLTRCVVLLFTLLVSFSPAAQRELEGVWRSQGYGYVFEIQGSVLKFFEVTATTCVPGRIAGRASAVLPGREATFSTQDGDIFFIRAGGSPDHKLLHAEGTVSDIRIDRIPKVPDTCVRATVDTPANNFDVFSRTWGEHYISFDLKQVDWNRLVAENRRNVTPQTSRVELFEILQSMIRPFGDAHTFVNAPSAKRRFEGLRPGTDRVAKGGFEVFHGKGMHELLGVTDRAYLTGPLREFCNDQVEYGHIDDTTGYLRIWSFSGYSNERGFDAGRRALEAALDEIFSDTTLRALVIDVRVNFGGDDPYGLEIASRLANTEYLAYTKYARAHPVDRRRWTPGDPSMVRPSSRPGFRGPVVILTGPLTISAGETLIQALMGRTPHVTRIGENTQGVFSDVLVRRLPNGWSFGLPNEVYRTPDRKTFDGAGIPPDIRVPVFADEDVAAGRDPAVAKAIEILSGRTKR